MAVIETIAGALKTRLGPTWLFWLGLGIQGMCVGTLVAATVLQLWRGNYSIVEKTAAILSLMFVVIMPITEAVVVYTGTPMFRTMNRKSITIAAAGICVVFMLTALPILVGIRRQVAWRAFNSLVPAILILVIVILSAFSALLFFPIFYVIVRPVTGYSSSDFEVLIRFA